MYITWINGDYITDSEACLHISDLSIQRGYGVFDFFRVKQKQPFLLNHYLNRFYHSAEGYNLYIPLEKAALTKVIHDFIDRNQLTDHGIKLILTGGYSDDGYTPAKPNLIIRAHNIAIPSKEKYRDGFKIMSNEFQRDTPECKSLDYRQGIVLLPQLRRNALDVVLFYYEGKVTEFPRSNFFMVDQNNKIITPANGILKGITRNVLLTVATAHYNVIERNLYLDELANASEAFLTSTTKLIMPICEIDGKPVGNGSPGPVTKHLAELLHQLPHNYQTGTKN